MIFALLFVFAAFVNSEIPVEGGVYVLSDGTFDTFVADNTYVLAEFYAPWCGHCKSLEPQYSAAATELQGSDIKLAKVDATVNEAVARKFNVRGYPTLNFFVDGVPQEYDGPRDSAGIVAWLKRKTQPPAKLDNVEDFEAKKNSEELLVLGVFKDLTSASATTFLQAAKKLEASIATTTSQDVRKHLGLSDDDQVILLKKYDNLRDDLGPVGTVEELVAKVSSHGRHLVTPFTEKYQSAIFAPQNTRIAFTVNDHQDAAGTEKDLACVSVVARKFREKVVFVDVDSSSPTSGRVLNYFGLESSAKSALVVYEPNANAKYRFTGSSLCDGLEEWVENYVNGKVDQFLKVQETPADWDAQPVKVLTGHNFQQVALDANKNAFVKFYAPWCGHCKSLAPVWDELAEYFKDRSDIVIGKVDSTLNELKGISIEGYPTLKFFNKKNEVLDYQGNRDLDSLKKYVEENSK